MRGLLTKRRLFGTHRPGLAAREFPSVRATNAFMRHGICDAAHELVKPRGASRRDWVHHVWLALSLACLVHTPLPSLAGDTSTLSLRIKLLAACDIETREDYPTEEKYIRLYGRRMPNTAVLIDPETRGLADAFVWVETKEAEWVTPPKPVVRTIYFAYGTFVPYALVAQEGDRLEVVNVDPVAFLPRTDFPEGSDFPVATWAFRFTLRNHVNRPVAVYSSTHLAPVAFIFVERSVECRLTDRLGDTEVPVRNTEEPLRVFLQHGVLGRLHVVVAPEGVKGVDQGVIEVAPELLKANQQILLIVTKERQEEGQRGGCDEDADD